MYWVNDYRVTRQLSDGWRPRGEEVAGAERGGGNMKPPGFPFIKWRYQCWAGGIVVRPKGDGGRYGTIPGSGPRGPRPVRLIRGTQQRPAVVGGFYTLSSLRRPGARGWPAGWRGSLPAATASLVHPGGEPRDAKQMCEPPAIFPCALWCVRTVPFRK